MLRPMQFVFEDSEVAQLQISEEVLTARFSAARVVEGGRTGSGEGQWMRLLLICELNALSDNGLQASGRLEGGRVRVGGQTLRSLPLSYEVQQPFVLELDFASGHQVRLQGHQLQLRTPEGAGAVESFQCG